MLFGGCVVIPAFVVASRFAIRSRKEGKLSRLALGLLMAGLWVPAALAVTAELHWILVEEPRRIAAGLPI